MPCCLSDCRKLPVLRVTEQRGLGPWQPGSSTAPPKLTVAQQAAAGGTVEAEEASSYSYEELLLQLPGLQRQLRVAAQERAGLPSAEREVDVAHHPDDRMDRPLQPPLTEWDLRAKMEKRKRQQREVDGERAGLGWAGWLVGQRDGQAGRGCGCLIGLPCHMQPSHPRHLPHPHPTARPPAPQRGMSGVRAWGSSPPSAPTGAPTCGSRRRAPATPQTLTTGSGRTSRSGT